MKKKVIAAMLAGAMVLGTLTGCGNGSETGGEDNSGQASGQDSGSDQASDESGAGGSTELTFIFADGDEGAKESMKS